MLAPNAEQIETAAEQIKQGQLSGFIRDSQRKELHSAVGAVSDDFVRGYELGVQTARVVLQGSTALMLKGVDPKDVL